MFRGFRLLFAIPLVAGAGAPLPTQEATALRARFEARQRETQTWSATFVQTLALEGMREPVVSAGRIAYRAPQALRLDFTRPAAEYVLVLGDRLFIKKSGARLAERSLREHSAGRPFRSLLGLLRGQPPEEGNAYRSEVIREDGRYAVVLTRDPEASSLMPARITNHIAADTLEVREVLVELPEAGTLSYRFEAIQRNGPIDLSNFAVPSEPTTRDLR